MKVRPAFILLSVIITVSIYGLSLINPEAWWAMTFFGPLILIGYLDIFQKKHTIRKNFPVIGHGRYILEAIRPEIMQYFVETDVEGQPFNRLSRSMIYQRAKGVTDTTPFGTQVDVYQAGYEWMVHSIYAAKPKDPHNPPRIAIGGPECKQVYHSSILNISAMSYGALSKNAVLALNKGARLDNFAHNTGEGSVSPYHLENGGDLIWQIGTGYFGCRTKEGDFSAENFKKTASHPNIKMIEIKISQGAKPGHGGILPAKKNTLEIAQIRGVEPFTDVHSPPSHKAFSNATELMYFIKQLRDLSDGKPVGFKLCIGKRKEFIDICKAMIETKIQPDFITIDGGEGGTGAAPVEFSNTLGMPLRDALSFVYDTLVGFRLKKDIKLIASGKIITGFDMVRVLALGADLCNSARGMMMAIGCIQALRCNTNECPVGVATQDKTLMKGLDVEDKAKRAASFHKKTIESFVELLSAGGLTDPAEIRREHINRRVSMETVMKYSDIFPYLEEGCLLNEDAIPENYKRYL